ncbi:hypothetical protein [Actinophytocola gossypii]|uniref:Cupin n=1 Tax=Actinophytocola gossypii TaxID=2812003 RepID=A0ABT2J2I1_9PSEU|nr:hypothetical protein [Actinophytocola gossypii]MCT2582060.1 hypothetical protein [Actinophytocola gossypii]
MYDKTDARATLATASGPAPGPAPKGRVAAPELADFYREEPQETTAAGSRTWLTRGQNFVLAYTSAVAGEEFVRTGQPDEYVVVLPHDESAVQVTAAGRTETVTGRAVIVVPPGDSTVTATADRDLVRLFTSRSEDLAARCGNADSYAEPHPHVAPFAAWPDPPAGFDLRVYPVADIPEEQGRFGRIFRCSTFMVNFLYPRVGPRDPSKLSPHHHDDFEQCSLAVGGEFVHHIRTPWTTDLADWREDVHHACGSPSVAVIPPPTVHTTQATGQGTNQLIDIFCPPRADFSAKPGWVLNAEEYPAP